MPPSEPSFEEMIDAAQRSAVHLEMRDQYAVSSEDDDFRRWRESGSAVDDPDSDFWREWVGLVRRTVARGVAVRRVRIVSEPVTEYVRYEHAGTPVNLGAGEQVRWLPRRRASDLALPGNDFWLFDGRVVLWHHFSGAGESVADEVSEDPAAAKLCASAFEAVWSRAVLHEDYEIQ
ncbi:DUF6879 family protein [Streptomyces synnematoformans]|uniref:DUF6879 domain-containing protein n=1 Tax=Streptomyces synnematoformans TaxID=415721 RepID=A0ABN1ZK40_9ACTN